MSRRLLALALLLAGPALAQAQGLPRYRAINPLIASRSVLGFEPVTGEARGWQTELLLEYASIVELSRRPAAELVLDAEVLRLGATVTRRVGGRGFVRATATMGGAYAGFLDGPLNWYHDLLGFDELARDARPDNVFEYRLTLPDGTSRIREPRGAFLNDLVLGAGVLHSPRWQTALTVGLPTATSPEGYGLGTVAAAVTTTARTGPLGDRVTLEGSLGVGVTPRHGDLEAWQRTLFTAATGGLRLRFWGRQSAYANLYYHSSVYRGTALPSANAADVAIDVGFLLQPGGGPEILAGLAEDLSPRGPAVDAVFRLGLRW